MDDKCIFSEHLNLCSEDQELGSSNINPNLLSFDFLGMPNTLTIFENRFTGEYIRNFREKNTDWLKKLIEKGVAWSLTQYC